MYDSCKALQVLHRLNVDAEKEDIIKCNELTIDPSKESSQLLKLKVPQSSNLISIGEATLS